MVVFVRVLCIVWIDGVVVDICCVEEKILC